MSYWPGEAGGKKDVKVDVTHKPHFPKSYTMDCRLEGARCDREIQLSGLDEGLMCDAWRSFVSSGARYNIVPHNCSTVAASVLEVGSSIQPSFVPKTRIDDHVHDLPSRLALRVRFFGTMINMWTPRCRVEVCHGDKQP